MNPAAATRGDGGQCGGPDCGECCDFGWEVFDGHCGPWLRGLSVFAGVDGFKGPVDRRHQRQLRFQRGLNLARPLEIRGAAATKSAPTSSQGRSRGAPRSPSATKPFLPPLGGRPSLRREFSVAPCAAASKAAWHSTISTTITTRSSDLKQIRSDMSYVFDGMYQIGYYGATAWDVAHRC